LTTPSDIGPPKPSTGKDPWFWWRLAIGIGLLVLLVGVVGLDRVIAAASDARPGWALTVVAMAGLWLCLGAVNVWILLRRLAPIPLRAFLGVYITSWAASLLIPGQLGDVTQVLLLRRHGVDPSRSGAAYVVDKVVSLSWMLAAGACGVALYLPRVRGWWLVAPPVLIVAALLAALALLRRAPATEAQGRVRRFLFRLSDQVRSFRAERGALAANIALTGLRWTVMSTMYLLAFQAFGSPIGLVAAGTIPVIASLAGYLPVTVGGAGVMEWTAVALFRGLAVEEHAVVVAYLFLRTVLLVWALMLLLVMRERGLPEAKPSAS
jgi:uncharacterized membrane protein YbhN (UPF0104 family)